MITKLFSTLTTPDGTMLVSQRVHDYVSHKDANGEIYMLDGGTSYVRTSVNREEGSFRMFTTQDAIADIREHWTWGTYGPDGCSPLTYVKLKDLSDDHIVNILHTKNLSKQGFDILFRRELEYRNVNGCLVHE